MPGDRMLGVGVGVGGSAGVWGVRVLTGRGCWVWKNHVMDAANGYYGATYLKANLSFYFVLRSSIKMNAPLLAIIAKYGFPVREWVYLYQGFRLAYEQISTVQSVRADDSIAELAITGKNKQEAFVVCNLTATYITEMVTDQCAIPYEEKEDCGHYGIEKEECLERGCCWVPSKRPNDPWCFSAKPGVFRFNQSKNHKKVRTSVRIRGEWGGGGDHGYPCSLGVNRS